MDCPSRSAIAVRAAAWDERDRVAYLARRCGPGVKTFFDVHNPQEYFDRGDVLVAEIGARMLGFAMRRFLVREPGVVSLYEIGVHPDVRRAGIGSALMTAVLAGRPVMRLVVGADNDGAIRFYHRHGLREVEKRQTRHGQWVLKMEGAWPSC